MSVGNLAMGGRGKTPVAGLVARLLAEAGERPAIVSRGYRRRRPEDGVTIVSDGREIRADLDRAGDEPLMLARAVPGAAVLVCDVRAMGIALAERQLGATVHVLDDGFQHHAVARDIDIVIVTPQDLHGRRVPFGRLRSPVRALAAADAIVVDGAEPEAVADILDRVTTPGRTAVFALRRSLGAPVPLRSTLPWPSERGPVIALAAIAEPARFARALQNAGWRVADGVTFPDHHAYTRRDLDRVADAMSRGHATAVLTTEKDAVRLQPLEPLPMPVAAVPLEIDLTPAAAFRQWLLARIREARA